jgi:hypothetical protein
MLKNFQNTRLIFDPEDGGDTFLRNVGSYIYYTALYLRRWQISLHEISPLLTDPHERKICASHMHCCPPMRPPPSPSTIMGPVPRQELHFEGSSWTYRWGKVTKLQLSLCLINEALCHDGILGSGGIAPPFSTSGHWMEVSDQLHAPTTLLLEKISIGTHWIGGWVGPRSGLGAVEKRKILHLPGIEPEACRYTDWAIRTSNVNGEKKVINTESRRRIVLGTDTINPG